MQGQLRGLVRQLSIDQFENESRRVSMGAGKTAGAQASMLLLRCSTHLVQASQHASTLTPFLSPAARLRSPVQVPRRQRLAATRHRCLSGSRRSR